MLRVGLTGGISCGKTTVGKMFSDLGAHLIEADTIAHELYRPGEPVYQELVARFGPDIVRPDGEIDRPRLATAAFDNGRVEELNKIVHPAVIKRQEQWMYQIGERDPYAVAMVEAALILEAGARERFDTIIVVTCRPEQKVARYAARSSMPELAARSEVERRSKAQMSDDEKVRRADFAIDNSGPVELTRHQVERIYAELRVLAKRQAFQR
ncbi:MAG TPA: dephospho-CoA kinase [Candidatus Angelobacter sp.]|jgi:dephospho-CoA kinase|nr:dephospho-CoA kinase [Candidatus Angelobacter sp.]HKT49074.1 dephospho-CoA kinase [Candidatus Angelobacter sp.]